MDERFNSKYKELFMELINCNNSEWTAGVSIGVTRMGELDSFTDTYMREWTRRAEQEFTDLTSTLLEKHQTTFLLYRFCTYTEFEELHTIRKDGRDAIIFRLLSIRDAGAQDKFKKRFEHSREGYFALMEVMNPKLRAFFFQMFGVSIPSIELQKHAYIVGATGSGKSELLKNLVRKQIKENESAIVVLDPKGDLTRDISRFADHYLPYRWSKLVYISPFDFAGQTPIINPLELPPHHPEEYETLVRLTIQELGRTLDNIFSEIMSGFTGAMKSVLSPCLETLIRKGDADFWDLLRFMDDKLNDDLVHLGMASPNPAVRLFFTHSFRDISSETKKGIEWRCRNLLKSQVFAGLTSGKTTVHLKELIDKKCCILFNLDKGGMGTEVSACFGKLVVSMIQVLAMQRGGLPEEQKTPIHLYIDEFHNYTTAAIRDILAEARSNKLYLTLAQQLVGQGIQGDRDFKRVLLGNTNVKILGRSTQENCKDLSDEFGLPVAQLLDLPKYFFYVKVGNGKAFRLKGRDELVKGKNAMEHEQWKELEAEQLSRYYVPAALAIEQRMQEEMLRMPSLKETHIKAGKGKGSKSTTLSTKKEKDDTDQPDDVIAYPLS